MKMSGRFQILFLFLVLSIGLHVTDVHSQQNTMVAPQVLAVQPFPGEEIPLDSPLTVVFNQDMNQVTVESAWSIVPAVEGVFRWENGHTLNFMPLLGWERDFSYELTIGQTAADANGQSLPDAYQATLRTVGRLIVNSVIPAENTEGVATDATITVAFNRPVVPLGSTADLASLSDPLTITPSVDGQGEWLNTCQAPNL